MCVHIFELIINKENIRKSEIFVSNVNETFFLLIALSIIVTTRWEPTQENAPGQEQE